eukprot:SAG31_NODE_15396_length_757_cov_1.000000_1_plen_187_part_00
MHSWGPKCARNASRLRPSSEAVTQKLMLPHCLMGCSCAASTFAAIRDGAAAKKPLEKIHICPWQSQAPTQTPSHIPRRIRIMLRWQWSVSITTSMADQRDCTDPALLEGASGSKSTSASVCGEKLTCPRSSRACGMELWVSCARKCALGFCSCCRNSSLNHVNSKSARSLLVWTRRLHHQLLRCGL